MSRDGIQLSSPSIENSVYIWTIIVLIFHHKDHEEKTYQRPLYQGDVTRLIKFRERLSTKLVVAFDTGKQVAHQLWSEASEDMITEFMEYGADKFKNTAKSLADSGWSLAEQSWFIEAFCIQWQQEWTENVRPNMDSG